MNDEQLRQAYAGWLEQRASGGREACVSPEALLALVEQRGSEAERLATLDHAMSCAACRHDLETLRAVVAAGVKEGVAAGAGAPASWSPGFRIAATVTLLAVAGTALFMAVRPDGSGVVRGGNDVETVAPAGDVSASEARTLLWRRQGNAERYRVELLTSSGDSVHAAETVDTTLTLPASVTLDAPGYLWTVSAIRAGAPYATSAPRRFRIIR